MNYRVKVTRNEYSGYETARLNISVGQAYHENQKFLALCEWVSRHFENSIVNVCDSLQRHNLKLSGLSDKQALDMAVAAGDAWIERNHNALMILPNLTIMRWNEWLQKDEYKQYQTKVYNLYKTDSNFHNNVNDTARHFTVKIHNGNEKAMIASCKYILEEVAVSYLMGQQNAADIYPGTFLPAFDYLRNKGENVIQSKTGVSFLRRKDYIENAA